PVGTGVLHDDLVAGARGLHGLLPAAADLGPRQHGPEAGCSGGPAGGLLPQALFRLLGRPLLPPARGTRLGEPTARLCLVPGPDPADLPQLGSALGEASQRGARALGPEPGLAAPSQPGRLPARLAGPSRTVPAPRPGSRRPGPAGEDTGLSERPDLERSAA